MFLQTVSWFGWFLQTVSWFGWFLHPRLCNFRCFTWSRTFGVKTGVVWGSSGLISGSSGTGCSFGVILGVVRVQNKRATSCDFGLYFLLFVFTPSVQVFTLRVADHKEQGGGFLCVCVCGFLCVLFVFVASEFALALVICPTVCPLISTSQTTSSSTRRPPKPLLRKHLGEQFCLVCL